MENNRGIENAGDKVEFVKLHPDEWQQLRDLRIRALKDSPKSFGSTVEETERIPESTWRERLEKGQYICVRKGGELVGMVSVVKEEGEKVEHVARIYSVFLAPEARGGGIAQALLEHAMKWITKDRKMTKFILDVGVHNDAARKLYMNLGFREVGTLEKELFVDGEYLDEIVMEKIVS